MNEEIAKRAERQRVKIDRDHHNFNIANSFGWIVERGTESSRVEVGGNIWIVKNNRFKNA